jgi:ParB family chromosome partitioning protein
MAKPVLGRGLSALLGGMSSGPKTSPFSPAPPQTATANTMIAEIKEGVQHVAIQRVRPCPFQPRKDFSEDSIRELADSIREKGIVQPLIVRQKENDFELIAGERRWRAAQLVGLNELPVIVREADDRTVLELALIENLQRENLNAIEEALGYSQLIEQFQLKQEEAAAKVGKSRAVVANALRLLKLAPQLQTYVRNGQLSVGHAKVILGLNGHEQQNLAAERILKNSLSVRQTEELITLLQKAPGTGGSGGSKAVPHIRDTHVVDLENKLTEKFGTKVQLRYRQGKGSLEIKFFNDDDLERILKIAGISLD